MAIPLPYGTETSEDMRRAGEALGTDLIAKKAIGAYEALQQADQNLARSLDPGGILENAGVLPHAPPMAPATPPATPPTPPAPAATPATPPASPLADALKAPPTADPALLTQIAKQVGPDVRETRTVQTAGEQQAIKDLDAAHEQGRKVVGQSTQLERDKANTLETSLKDEQTKLGDYDKQAQERRQKADQAIGEADTYLKAKREEYEKDGFKDFYSERGTLANVMSVLSVGLGGYASSLTGGPNQAWSILQSSMARWETRERNRLAKSKEMVDLASRDVATAERRKELGEVEIANHRIALIDNLKREREVRLAKHGAREAEIQGDALLHKMDEQQARDRIEIEKGLRRVIQTDNSQQNALQRQALLAQHIKYNPDKTQKDASEGEKKMDAFLIRGFEEVKNLVGMKAYSTKDQKEIEAWRTRVSSVQQTAPEKLYAAVDSMSGDVLKRLSPQGQKRFLAEKNYARSILRPESGAVIGGTEYADQLAGVQVFQTHTPDMAQQMGQRMRRDLEGLAVQSYRPGYWNSQINGSAAPAKGLTPAQMAAAVQWLEANPNHEDAPPIRRKLAGK